MDELFVNEALRTRSQVDAAIEQANDMTLGPHPSPAKTWDNMKAIQDILALGSPTDSVIVDLGCRHGVTLTWLARLGFHNLFGCDARYPWPPLKTWLKQGQVSNVISALRALISGQMRLSVQDILNTNYFDDQFDFSCCMSVIEHGIDLSRFFREAARILKPGGYLFISTDFWPDYVDTSGIAPYGESLGETRVYRVSDVERMVEYAASNGLELTAPIDYTIREPIVRWRGLKFTFLYFSLKKC